MLPLVKTYQRLVTADESPLHLDQTLQLIDRIASGGGGNHGSRWLDLREGGSSGSIRVYSGPLARRVNRVSFALAELPKRIKEHWAHVPNAQYSLLMDSLLLLFHQAYFALLPDAGDQREHLLDVFVDFADVVPRTADRFQILGLVRSAEEEFEEAADAFRSSVLAAHADDHDFLSRVQLCWTQLMAHGRDDEAFKFLMDTSYCVTRSDLEEFNGLLLQTYRASHAK